MFLLANVCSFQFRSCAPVHTGICLPAESQSLDSNSRPRYSTRRVHGSTCLFRDGVIRLGGLADGYSSFLGSTSEV
jgi:hypothetical protein